MLKVLIIEDTEDRQKILTSLYRSQAWVLVNTGHRAVKLIHAYKFDIISLDYNLRGEIDGAEVAVEIKQSQNRDSRIVIHSLNPKGVDKIEKILPAAIPYPVSKIVRSNQRFKKIRDKINTLGIAYDWN
ncbi:MAG: cyclic-phosphate processing receiver domain-containing protein [Cyanobacteriota bacterium]|nr:cyclic-phosphate processing receiver domain-containing protein [Cyanobacteriota bacterium]